MKLIIDGRQTLVGTPEECAAFLADWLALMNTEKERLRDQAHTRGRKPRMLTAWGEAKTVREWLADPRCAIHTWGGLTSRLDRGWGPERAISEPAFGAYPGRRT